MRVDAFLVMVELLVLGVFMACILRGACDARLTPR
jgi:hypothetical protein